MGELLVFLLIAKYIDIQVGMGNVEDAGEVPGDFQILHSLGEGDAQDKCLLRLPFVCQTGKLDWRGNLEMGISAGCTEGCLRQLSF